MWDFTTLSLKKPIQLFFFSHEVWSSAQNKVICLYLQVSTTLQNIVANLKCAVVWMASILPRISCSCSLFGDHSKGTNYNWYHRHPHVPQLFFSSGKILVFAYVFAFSHFHAIVRWNDKIHKMTNSFLLGLVSFGLILWHINHFRLFNAESTFIHIWIQFCLLSVKCKNSSISNILFSLT